MLVDLTLSLTATVTATRPTIQRQHATRITQSYIAASTASLPSVATPPGV
jgi:hypothetical protein